MPALVKLDGGAQVLTELEKQILSLEGFTSVDTPAIKKEYFFMFLTNKMSEIS